MRGGETWQVLVFRNWYRCSVHGFSPLPGLDLTTPALRPQSRAGSSITASAFAPLCWSTTVPTTSISLPIAVVKLRRGMRARGQLMKMKK